ncbi:MAG: hypothetical protein ACRDYA_04620 [Egibacteraceae bacterium]
MIGTIAHDAGEFLAGDYAIGYAVEKAEDLYHLDGGELAWKHRGQACATAGSTAAASPSPSR